MLSHKIHLSTLSWWQTFLSRHQRERYPTYPCPIISSHVRFGRCEKWIHTCRLSCLAIISFGCILTKLYCASGNDPDYDDTKYQQNHPRKSVCFLKSKCPTICVILWAGNCCLNKRAYHFSNLIPEWAPHYHKASRSQQVYAKIREALLIWWKKLILPLRRHQRGLCGNELLLSISLQKLKTSVMVWALIDSLGLFLVGFYSVAIADTKGIYGEAACQLITDELQAIVGPCALSQDRAKLNGMNSCFFCPLSFVPVTVCYITDIW